MSSDFIVQRREKWNNPSFKTTYISSESTLSTKIYSTSSNELREAVSYIHIDLPVLLLNSPW